MIGCIGMGILCFEMAKEKDEEREHRIHEEIIVDAYGEYEQAMSRYYHMEENPSFPLHQTINHTIKNEIMKR
jgi:Calcium binding